MTNLHNLTVAELRKVVAIKEKIELWQGKLESIAGGAAAPEPSAPRRRKRRHMSAAARARIGAAQRAG